MVGAVATRDFLLTGRSEAVARRAEEQAPVLRMRDFEANGVGDCVVERRRDDV